MKNDQLKTPVFSKLLIGILIFVAVCGAAFIIWASFAKDDQTLQGDERSTATVAESVNDSTAPDSDDSEINGEIEELDTIIGSVDDSSLGDSGYSESDMGIE